MKYSKTVPVKDCLINGQTMWIYPDYPYIPLLFVTQLTHSFVNK